MDDLNWRLLMIEEVERISGSAGFRVFENQTGPYIISVDQGFLTADQVLELARMLSGLDLELTFTVRSTKQYSRVQFRWIERKMPPHQIPPPSDKTSLDKGTSPLSPIHHKYRPGKDKHHE